MKKVFGPQVGSEIRFLLFSQGCIISFPWYFTAMQLGTMSVVKPMKKVFGPQVGSEIRFLLFSQGCIISFPWYFTAMQLGTMSNI